MSDDSLQDEALRTAVAALFAHLIEHDDTWVVQIVREGAAQPPYVQGAWNADGTAVIEISNNDIHDPKLTSMQVAALAAFGWRQPDDEVPNHARTLQADADAAAVADGIVSTLFTALGFTAADRLDVEVFTSDLTDLIEAYPDLPLEA